MHTLYKIFSITFCFFLATAIQGANVVWFDGHHHVTYVAQNSYSPVVKTAIEMFSQDMKAVTGHHAQANHKGKIEIIELNKLTNKEFKKIQKRKLPYQKVIAKADAFYIGVHDGRVVVIGDNGRGTAYGILELSRMAGVSPWIWWGDIVPEQQKRLETDEKTVILQQPSVAWRGISVANEKWLQHSPNNQKLFELLLRLRANTLFVPPTQGKSAVSPKIYHKEAEHFEFSVVSALAQPALTWDDNSQWISTEQPGHVYYKAKEALRKNVKKTWIANVRNPKTAAYQLSLFLDLAWNENAVTARNLEQHLDKWLQQQFGKTCGHRLLPVMRKFYELTAVCQPEHMDKSQFNALAFGNELERYLGEFTILQQMAENIEKTTRPELRDAYFTAVKYPIQAATALAVKHLEAQESRLIARKESFHRDSEALTAAAHSIKAQRRFEQLTQHYQKMAHGKWNHVFPASLWRNPAFTMPALPDQLSADEISKYGNGEAYEVQINSSDCIVKNAADYASATEDAEIIPLLGHSTQAVALAKYGEITYKFNSVKRGNAVLYIAVVPNFSPADDENYFFSVSIDGNDEKIFSLRKESHDLRGQDIRKLAISLGMGSHTLTIRALNDHLILDQWMIDFNPKRQFFRFPI
ncbi:MAG: glycosyl hydrolase 115 family protein [Prevotella sp.]|nr:glycosyl hydrolase 115 family protein [Prevotella sp.]